MGAEAQGGWAGQGRAARPTSEGKESAAGQAFWDIKAPWRPSRKRAAEPSCLAPPLAPSHRRVPPPTALPGGVPRDPRSSPKGPSWPGRMLGCPLPAVLRDTPSFAALSLP